MEQPVGIEDGELRAQGCGRPITAGRRWDDECRAMTRPWEPVSVVGVEVGW